MALAHVQDSTLVTSSGTSAALSLSPTAGHTLIAFLGVSAATTRTFTVSDDVEGTTGWQTAVFFQDSGTNRVVAAYYKVAAPSGLTAVTITANATQTFKAAASEFSGFGGAVTVDASDSDVNPVASSVHDCSPAGVSSANPVLAVCAGVLTSVATECDPGTGYAEVPSGAASNNSLFQWRIFASGCTNEQGNWSSTGTNRVGVGAMALLSGAATSHSLMPLLALMRPQFYSRRRS